MSTTTVDHAIAIAASQQVVWSQISDLSKNPHWQTRCESISYLTTMHSGRGTRWRMRTRKGDEYVLEITAWYDGLGYEYTIVDGSAYVNNRGRVRLQEAPEGTVVQWTFNYELKGFLSGLRNSLQVKRSIDREIVESLQNLYTYIREMTPEQQFVPESTKSYLRDAPDVLERANYKPRYPSALERMKASTIEVRALEDATSGAVHPASIYEPPIAEDDTKQNPAVQPAEAPPKPEPDFLQDLPITNVEPGIEESQSLPMLEEADAFEQSTEAASILPTLEEDEPFAFEEEKLLATPPLPDILTRGESLDTAEISVFEIFGLQKPSETSRMRAIQDSDLKPATSTTTRIIPDVAPRESRRQGLRASLRQRMIKLRTPSA